MGKSKKRLRHRRNSLESKFGCDGRWSRGQGKRQFSASSCSCFYIIQIYSTIEAKVFGHLWGKTCCCDGRSELLFAYFSLTLWLQWKVKQWTADCEFCLKTCNQLATNRVIGRAKEGIEQLEDGSKEWSRWGRIDGITNFTLWGSLWVFSRVPSRVLSWMLF